MKFEYAMALAALAVGTLLIIFTGMPLWWLGGGLVAGGLALAGAAAGPTLGRLHENLREPRQLWGFEYVPLTVVYEVACILVLAAVTTVLLPEAALGGRPVDHDHTVHFYKAWQLENEFLAQGRLYGWSHEWFAGYPAQYLYPIGGDLLVVGVHWASLGLLSFSQSYGVAMWLFWFAGGYAVYRFATAIFHGGNLAQWSRWIGLLAGLFFLTDTAANRIGGWYFAMQWGVWPMSLGAVLSAWAMAKVPAIVGRPDEWRHLGFFGLLMGAAIISHPFMFIHFGIAIPLAVVAYFVAETDVDWPVALGRLGLAAGVGGLVAALWFLPFVSYSEFMDPIFGGRWNSAFQMGVDLYELDLLEGTWAVVTAFGLFGIVALFASKRFGHLLCALLASVFLLVGATDFVAGFHLLEAFEGFRYVHFKRFVTILKPYWVVAAGYGLVVTLGAAARGVGALGEGDGEDGAKAAEEAETSQTRQAGRRARVWRFAARVTLAVTLFAPLVVPFGYRFGREHVARDLTEPAERGFRRERDQFVDWINKKYPDGEPFFRIALKMYEHDHTFIDMGTRIPFPIYKIGYMPATSFKYRFFDGDPKLLEAINVRYVLSKRPLHDKKLYEKVKQFGRLHVYRFKRWEKPPFKILEGGGDVEVKRFDAEEIVLEAGQNAKGRLRLNVSYFANWSATRDGTPVSIDKTSLDIEGLKERTGFMTVDLKPGTYRFTFERAWVDWFGVLLWLLGMACVVVLVLTDGRWAPSRRLRGWLEGARDFVGGAYRNRPLVWDGAAGAVMALGLAYTVWIAVGSYPLSTQGTGMEAEIADVQYDFADQIRHATVSVGEGGGAKRCVNVLGRHICDKATWKHVHTRVDDFGFDYTNRRCIWAHPRKQGPVKITFPDVPVGEAIVGYFGVAESGKQSNPQPVDFKVGVDGIYQVERATRADEKLYTFEWPTEKRQKSGPMDVTFRVSADRPGRRHFCFNAQVVDLK